MTPTAAGLIPWGPVEGAGFLVAGPGQVLYEYGNRVWALGSDGLHEDVELGRRIARLPCPDGFDAVCMDGLGHTMLRARGKTNARSSRVRVTRLRAGAKQTTTVPGFFDVVALDDGLEAWLIAEGMVTRLAFVDRRGRVRRAPTPGALGPKVVGLSELGAQACASPAHSRMAPSNDGLVVLVTECHRDAALRVQRYDRQGTLVEEVRLPSLRKARLSLSGGGFTATRDGRAVIASPGRRARWGIERDGRWDVQEGSGPAGSLAETVVVADDGAVWMLTLGADDQRQDVWLLQRDGAVVELATSAGAPLSPRELAYDEDLGVVVLAFEPEGLDLHLAVERPQAEAPSPGGS